MKINKIMLRGIMLILLCGVVSSEQIFCSIVSKLREQRRGFWENLKGTFSQMQSPQLTYTANTQEFLNQRILNLLEAMESNKLETSDGYTVQYNIHDGKTVSPQLNILLDVLKLTDEDDDNIRDQIGKYKAAADAIFAKKDIALRDLINKVTTLDLSKKAQKELVQGLVESIAQIDLNEARRIENELLKKELYELGGGKRTFAPEARKVERPLTQKIAHALPTVTTRQHSLGETVLTYKSQIRELQSRLMQTVLTEPTKVDIKNKIKTMQEKIANEYLLFVKTSMERINNTISRRGTELEKWSKLPQDDMISRVVSTGITEDLPANVGEGIKTVFHRLRKRKGAAFGERQAYLTNEITDIKTLIDEIFKKQVAVLDAINPDPKETNQIWLFAKQERKNEVKKLITELMTGVVTLTEKAAAYNVAAGVTGHAKKNDAIRVVTDLYIDRDKENNVDKMLIDFKNKLMVDLDIVIEGLVDIEYED